MKLILIMQNGALAGTRHVLENGAFAVGRDDSCAVRFDLNERLVSKRHAVFSREPDGFYLTDNISTNGTYVNGSRVERVKLQPNDVIHFGFNGPQAVVSLESEEAATVVNAQNSMRFAPSNPLPPPNFIADNYSDARRVEGQSVRESFANLGLYNPEINLPHTENNQTGKYVAAAIGVVAVVLLSIIVIALTVLQLGIVTSIIATVLAFAGASIYILPLLWIDRYDPEPPLALAFAFAWGALIAILFSLVVNTAIGVFLGDDAATVISAPIFEEASKGLALILMLFFWRREFDGIVDGVVYAGVIALGFATVENVLYYGDSIIASTNPALVWVFPVTLLLRGVLSPFAHVIFTSMTGIGCGIARETHNTALRFIAPIAGYILAVILHMIWNGAATFVPFGLIGFLIFYAVFEFPFFLLFVGFIVYMLRRENKILKDSLGVEVAKGLISREQMEIATSAVKSLSWTLNGISTGKYLARRRFLRAVSKLGLAWWHISRANAAHGETRSFSMLPILEKDVKHWRTKI